MLFRAMSTLCGTIAATACLAQTAPKADPSYIAQCEVKGQNGMVTLVLCPKALSVEDFRQEGILACEGRLPCGAWFWTDASVMPEKAPDAHDALTQKQVTSALAVWMNEADRLVVLEKKSKQK